MQSDSKPRNLTKIANYIFDTTEKNRFLTFVIGVIISYSGLGLVYYGCYYYTGVITFLLGMTFICLSIL